jgi:hypothetical protein
VIRVEAVGVVAGAAVLEEKIWADFWLLKLAQSMSRRWAEAALGSMTTSAISAAPAAAPRSFRVDLNT